MANVVMTQARYVKAFEGEEVVELPGTRLYDDASVKYDEKKHKGWLSCRYCEAAVHFHRGSATICGQADLRGSSPHFSTNPKQEHGKDCLWPFLETDEGRPSHSYDDSAGFRLHLNTLTYSELFNGRAHHYQRDQDKKLVVNDEALKAMRPFSIKSVDDLVSFISKGAFERLRNSRILHNGWDLKWDEFFVRYARGPKPVHARHIALWHSLRGLPPRTAQPVLMEFNVASGVVPTDLFAQHLTVPSKSIFVRRDEQGRKHFIRPTAYLDNKDDTRVMHGFADAGRYLVMGAARLGKPFKGKGTVMHPLNIKVTDTRQFKQIDIAELARSPG
jgi:hypothetical protein